MKSQYIYEIQVMNFRRNEISERLLSFSKQISVILKHGRNEISVHLLKFRYCQELGFTIYEFL
jgi:hypothetical protein